MTPLWVALAASLAIAGEPPVVPASKPTAAAAKPPAPLAKLAKPGGRPTSTEPEPEFHIGRKSGAPPVTTDALVYLDGKIVSRRGAVINGEIYVPARDLDAPLGLSSRLDPSTGNGVLVHKRPTVTAPPLVSPLGQWVNVGALSIRILSVEDPEKIGSSYAAEGNRFLVLKAEVRVSGRDASDVAMVQGAYKVTDGKGASIPMKCEPPYVGAAAPGVAVSVRFVGEAALAFDAAEAELRFPGDETARPMHVRLR